MTPSSFRQRQQDEATVQAALAAAVFLWSPAAGAVALILSAAAATWKPRRWLAVTLVAAVPAGLAGLLHGWEGAVQRHLAWHRLLLGLFPDMEQVNKVLLDPAAWVQALGEQAWLAPLPAVLVGAALAAMGKDAETRRRQAAATTAPAGGSQQKTATRRTVRMPRRIPWRSGGLGVLGVWIDGDLTRWRSRRGLRRTGRWVVPPLDAYCQHGAVLGQPGSGKTVTLTHLAYLAAVQGCQVFYLDCKGSRQLPAEFITAMLDAGVDPDDIGYWPLDRFDVWRGDADAIANRILACIRFGSEAGYFEDIATQLVFEAVHDGPPPRSADEFMRRLRLVAGRRKGLAGQHADTTLERFGALFRAVQAPPERVQTDARTVEARSAGTMLDGGWSWEDRTAGVFTIAGLGAGKTSGAVGSLLLADLEHYATVRKNPDDQVFLIVDELGVLGAASVLNLVERAREAGIGVVVSAQTVAGLGDQAAAVLEAVSWVMAHRTSNPSTVAGLAGTVQDTRRTLGLEGDRLTGFGHVAERERWRVDPNLVRQLPRGEAVVISHGHSAHIRVRPPEGDPEVGWQWLRDRRDRHTPPVDVDTAELPVVEVVDVQRTHPTPPPPEAPPPPDPEATAWIS